MQATAELQRSRNTGRLVLAFVLGATAFLGLAEVQRLPREFTLLVLVATAWAATAGVRYRPDVVVVGDEGFCQRVLDHAGRAGRVRATWVVDPADATWGPGPILFRSDDLVVDGRLLQALRDRAPEVVAGHAMRVVERGQDAAAVLAEPLSPVARLAKRSLDVLVSIVIGLAMAPVLAVAILAIKIDSPGPGFFVQTRLGANGRRFRMYKLRTMAVVEDDSAERAWLQDMVLGLTDAESGLFKPPHSRRITRVGRILRRLSLDEVPQVWNVLRGQMSLVGPRPPLDDEAAVYDERAWQRLRGRPGLTGLSQISGRSTLCFSQIVDLDRVYLEQWSFWLELKILARTPIALVSARGAG